MRLARATAILVFSFGAAIAQDETAQTDTPVCVRPGTADIAEYKMSAGVTLPNAINTPLTDTKGSAIKGRELMVLEDRGNCTTCHAVADIRKRARTADSTSVTRFGIQGTVASALDGVASKYTEGELRLLIVNPLEALPDAKGVMPAYHHVEGLKRVRSECKGRAILTAQEVEDVLAYLVTLKTKSQ